jgi:hypothetical protein
MGVPVHYGEVAREKHFFHVFRNRNCHSLNSLVKSTDWLRLVPAFLFFCHNCPPCRHKISAPCPACLTSIRSASTNDPAHGGQADEPARIVLELKNREIAAHPLDWNSALDEGLCFRASVAENIFADTWSASEIRKHTRNK